MRQEPIQGISQEWRKVLGPLGKGSVQQQGQEEPRGDGNLGGTEWRFGLFRTRDPWVYGVWVRLGHGEGEMKGQEKGPEDNWAEEAWTLGAHEELA